MADNSNLTPEQIRLLQEQNRLYKQQLELQAEGYSLSTSYIESLKEVFGISSKLSTAENNLLSLNKKINKEILNQKSGFDKASDAQKQILKNADLLRKSQIQESSLLDEITTKDKNRVNQVNVYLDKINKIQKELDIELSKSKEERDLNKELIEDLVKQKTILDNMVGSRIENMSESAKALLYTRKQTQELKKQQELTKIEKKYLEDREKSLGIAGKLTQALSDIPGLGKIFGNPEYLNAVNEKIDIIYTKTGKFPNLFQTLGIQLGTASKMLLKTFADPTIYLGLMLKGFLSLNKAQTDFQKETGRTIDHFDTLNASLISSSDYIKQATALTKQFGFAADLIFTSNTLQEATELVELMGLSAEQAGKLAMYSKISGKDLKSTNENIVKYVSNFNKANRTAISQKQILQDVASVSNEIAIKFGGNPEKIAAAATEARKLGLTLEGVDRVAGSLLDFESSISNELSAELLTGKELNLEKARLYALNEDLAGLTKEIGNNEEIISAYTKGNRIQREAIAASIGMSKEDLASMVYQQQLQNGLTQEQAAAAAGVSLEDMKRLSTQESINKSIEKMGEALAGPLEMVAKILSMSGVIKTIFATIGGIITGKIVASLASAVVSIMASVAGAKAYSAALNQNLTKEAALTAMKVAGAEATTLGMATVPIIAGTAAVLASLAGLAYMAVKDAVFDPNKGPILSGEFGSVQLDPADKAMYGADGTIKVGTNLMGNNKNNSSQQDFSAILNKLDAIANRPVQVNTQLNMDGETIAKGTSKYADKMGTNFSKNTYSIS